jgi:hypothetical protein
MQHDDGEWAWQVVAEEPQQEEEGQRIDFIIDDYDGFMRGAVQQAFGPMTELRFCAKSSRYEA